MIFGPDHYVPVLKAKKGEKEALLGIHSSLCARITPLLEIVERASGEKSIETHLDTAFKGLKQATAQFSRCLIDAREIESDGEVAAQAVFERATVEGIVFTPVTGISRTADIVPALSHSSNGIAIRLTRKEFEEGGLARRLSTYMTNHSLVHAQVDLIIDLGAVDQMVQDGVYNLTNAFLGAVPDQALWRTLTLSGCAFPPGMGLVDRDSHDSVERVEWRAWRDRLYANRHALTRLPTFSDCGIQNPKGVEGFNFRTMQPSAAIRYTLENDWLLIKGVGTRSIRPGQQFPDLAKKLVYGHLQSNFAGMTHCSGCAGMKSAADGLPKFGSAGVWRRLGTIHHITKVTQALAALPWP